MMRPRPFPSRSFRGLLQETAGYTDGRSGPEHPGAATVGSVAPGLAVEVAVEAILVAHSAFFTRRLTGHLCRGADSTCLS
jgi:hypothetical protein